jgi:putative membrane protein
MSLIIRLIAGALAFWAATSLISGVDVIGGAWSYLWVALLFGLINGILGSIVKLLTLPAILITLGLFSLVVNAAMLMLTARWSDRLDVVDFWSALWASLIISLITTIITKSLKSKKKFNSLKPLPDKPQPHLGGEEVSLIKLSLQIG